MYLDSLFGVAVHHGLEVMGHLVILYLQSGIREISSSLIFIKCGTLAHGLVLPTFRVSHSCCDQPFWKLSHRHT